MAGCGCEEGKIFSRYGCPIHGDPEGSAKKPEARISLNQEDFRALIRGKIVEVATTQGIVKIALRDIGWPVMIDEIDKAWAERER